MKKRSQKPLLSICIPTYNGAAYIRQTLESLKLSKNSDVEIVICDDASTDDTVERVKRYQKKFPNIELYRNRKNLGFDRNMIEVVKYAKGGYCWYMGQDDYLSPGALEKVKRIISEKHPSLLMTNFARYDNKQKKFTAQRMIEGQPEQFLDSQSFFFRRTKKSYFPFLGVNLIYISILVFKKRYWKEALRKAPARLIGSDFFHTFVMTRLIADHPEVYYYSKPIVVYRDKNIRLWGNRDIWGYYVKHYLPYTLSLGWNPLKVRYAQIVVKIHNSPKRGAIARAKSAFFSITGAARKVLGISQNT